MKQAADVLYLWYVAEPAKPRPVGTLRLVNRGRGVSLQYADRWLAAGFAISEDLPLTSTEFIPAARDEAAGALEDARPDRWGERVIQVLEKPSRLSIHRPRFPGAAARAVRGGVAKARGVSAVSW